MCELPPPPSARPFSERDVALRVAHRFSINTAHVFDALHVSARSAVPASSLASDDMALSVERVHEAFMAAWEGALAGVIGVREKEGWSEMAPAEDEREDEVDARLREARVRARDAEIGFRVAEGRKEEVGKAVGEMARFVGVVGLESAEEAEGARIEVESVGEILGKMRAVLEMGREDDPILEKVAVAIEGAGEKGDLFHVDSDEMADMENLGGAAAVKSMKGMKGTTATHGEMGQHL